MITDPDTGEIYWLIGCSRCESGLWRIGARTKDLGKSARVAFICVGCGHAAKGIVTMEEPLQPEPDSRARA